MVKFDLMKLLCFLACIGWFLVPAALPQALPSHGTSDAAPDAGIYGVTGLWKVYTAQTLRAGQASFSASYDRINRNPGYLTISTMDFGGSLGLTNRLEVGADLEANRHVLVGRAEQLSFGQQALGFFGDKTPGSPPLPAELVQGSSQMPQLRNPSRPDGALTGAAGYYNLLPFAGLVGSGGAVGLLSFHAKFSVLSQSDDSPLHLALHACFGVPIHKSIDFLLTHPVGTADLQFGFDGIASMSLGDAAELHLNVGYRHINQPAHVSVFRLAEELPLGFGIRAPRHARFQFMGESTAEVFIGSHTPNTTFGPEVPVDLTLGLLGHIGRHFSVSAGYRRPLNQLGGDKNGFVLGMAYYHLPVRSRPAP